MKLLILLSICSSLALNAWTQPSPCVSPPFMTGDAYMQTEIGGITTSGSFNYDALGQQLRIRCSGISLNGTFSLDLLMQFQQINESLTTKYPEASSEAATASLTKTTEKSSINPNEEDPAKVAYEINSSTRTCKKVALDAPFNPIQIPPGSFPVAQTVLGTGSVAGMGLLANTWYGEIPQIQAKYTLNFSDNACVPLSGTYSSPESGTIIISFYNILLGVRDPMDFIPPYFCRSEEQKNIEDLPKSNFFRLVSYGSK